jgi:hypothetical protein
MYRVYKLNGMQTQSELIEAIAEAVCDRLEPILKQIEEKNDVGVLVGAYQISRYIGLKHNLNNGGGKGVHSQTIKRWYNTKGFPMNKNPKGK